MSQPFLLQNWHGIFSYLHLSYQLSHDPLTSGIIILPIPGSSKVLDQSPYSVVQWGREDWIVFCEQSYKALVSWSQAIESNQDCMSVSYELWSITISGPTMISSSPPGSDRYIQGRDFTTVVASPNKDSSMWNAILKHK